MLAAFGITLDVIGIGLAAWGVDELSRELFPQSPLPHRRLGRAVRRLSLRILGRRSVVTKDLGLAWEIDSAGKVRPLAMKPMPESMDAPVSEWFRYFISRFEAVEQRITWEAFDRDEADDKALQRIRAEEQRRREADDEVREEVRGWVAGKGGRGLLIAFYGLALSVLGGVLQLVAAL